MYGLNVGRLGQILYMTNNMCYYTLILASGGRASYNTIHLIGEKNRHTIAACYFRVHINYYNRDRA